MRLLPITLLLLCQGSAFWSLGAGATQCRLKAPNRAVGGAPLDPSPVTSGTIQPSHISSMAPAPSNSGANSINNPAPTPVAFNYGTDKIRGVNL